MGDDGRRGREPANLQIGDFVADNVAICAFHSWMAAALSIRPDEPQLTNFSEGKVDEDFVFFDCQAR